MESCGGTNIGYVKKRNEDRYVIKKYSNGFLLVVADGVGGNIAGHHAAKKVVEVLGGIDVERENPDGELADLILKTHDQILDKIDEFPKLEGMGATATAAFVKDNRVYWAHVGDSRLYRINQEKIEQITNDHTMAQFLLDEGAITEDDESFEMSKNFLVQCVGGSECEPDSGSFSISKGEFLILASDGLHDFVEDSIIHKIVTETSDLKTAVDELIKAALETGGKDNITIAAFSL